MPPASAAPASELVGSSGASQARRRADLLSDCSEQPGKPAPEPLRIQYNGVAKSARCQREVYTIMGGITHFLGVECRHCHLEPDYAADTHNKRIANWMATELVPRLQQREAKAREARGAAPGTSAATGVWCNDCHAGKAKFLGSPRRREFAIEWMTTHLVESFTTLSDKPAKCKDCHGGDLGSPQFRGRIILSELPGLPAPAQSVPASQPSATPAPATPMPAIETVPDYGPR